MRLINFAHGELITLAAYALLALFGLPVPVMLFGALAVAVVLALVTERAAFRPLRGADPTTLLISSFAVSFFLQKLLILVVGSRLKGLDFLPALGRQIEFAGVRLQMLQIVTIVVSAVLLVGLTWFLQGDAARPADARGGRGLSHGAGLGRSRQQRDRHGLCAQRRPCCRGLLPCCRRRPASCSRAWACNWSSSPSSAR